MIRHPWRDHEPKTSGHSRQRRCHAYLRFCRRWSVAAREHLLCGPGRSPRSLVCRRSGARASWPPLPLGACVCAGLARSAGVPPRRVPPSARRRGCRLAICLVSHPAVLTSAQISAQVGSGLGHITMLVLLPHGTRAVCGLDLGRNSSWLGRKAHRTCPPEASRRALGAARGQ